MTTSLNVSGKIDSLSIELLQAVNTVAAQLGVPFCIVGAFARDVVLGLGYGMNTGQATLDIDFVVMVRDWQQFDTFRQSLLATGNFSAATNARHRLTFKNILQLDIVPFGTVERRHGEIAWPPDFETVMSTIGIREAASRSIAIRVTADLTIPFISPAALALLKLIAWSERGGATPGKDSRDFSLVINNYLRCGNASRLHDEFAALLDDREFDMNSAGPSFSEGMCTILRTAICEITSATSLPLGSTSRAAPGCCEQCRLQQNILCCFFAPSPEDFSATTAVRNGEWARRS